MLMFPFAYNCEEVPADLENLYEATIGASKAVKTVHGRHYETGPVCEISYASGGDSVDWVYENG